MTEQIDKIELTSLLELCLDAGYSDLSRKLIRLGADISEVVNPTDKRCIVDVYMENGMGESLLEFTPHDHKMRNGVPTREYLTNRMK